MPETSGPPPEFVQRLTASQSAMYAFIVSLLGGANDADDVLQETNMKLCRRWSQYDRDQPFLRWAYAFARFEIMAYRKSKQRSRLVLDNTLVATIAGELEESSENADSRLKLLEVCLKRLNARQRELIFARYGRGEAVRDIAARLSRPENAMAALFYRLRKILADCVQSLIGRERMA
ncbi:MAG: sigma-70 family RNA polymerase sigma factor [Chthoniobacterales bacterium]|nr:sigma-70 family RNA polymerase sigma factor [Chthoniobacterales bacterium]